MTTYQLRNMDAIVIFSARIARDLIQNKFELMDIRPDQKLRVKTVFYFMNTEEIKEHLKLKHNVEI